MITQRSKPHMIITFTLALFILMLPTVASSQVAPNVVAIQEVLAGEREEANAAWWGFDPEDATAHLQMAINSGAPRVIIPNMGTDWIVRPIFLRSNLELILEDGAVVQAKKGEYHGRTDSVFTAHDVENLVIRGYGATIRMHKSDYQSPDYERAEWRMGINLRGTKNVEILGLTIEETGGDGIYLGRGTRFITNENVVIRDVVADNNHRQGVSVITAKNLLIEDSLFRYTSGTAPMAGIDFEPNRPDEVLENIVVRNSVFEGNDGYGILIYLANLDERSNLSFLFEDILIRGGGYGIYIDSVSKPGKQPVGEVIVRNCIIEDTMRDGIRIINKDKDGLNLVFEDCVIHGAANQPDSVPIYLWGGRVEGTNQVGGIRFDNVVVADERDRPAILTLTNPAMEDGGFFNIEGRIEVINPYGAEFVWDGLTEGISLSSVERDSYVIDYEKVTSFPEYVDAPVEVRVKPTLRVHGLSSIRPYTTVRGILEPNIELRHFEEENVLRAQAFVGDELVYDADKPPFFDKVVIDTLVWDDAQHELRIVVEGTQDERIETTAYFLSQNFRQVIDLFEGPRELAWFGTVYNPVSIDQSEGWEYVTDNAGDFFGDNTRKRREANSTEYIVWETPGLKRFVMEVYSQGRVLDDVLSIEVSNDQQTWHEVSYGVEPSGISSAGWHRLSVRGNVSEPGEVGYVRLVLNETESHLDVQLGQAQFQLLRDL